MLKDIILHKYWIDLSRTSFYVKEDSNVYVSTMVNIRCSNDDFSSNIQLILDDNLITGKVVFDKQNFIHFENIFLKKGFHTIRLQGMANYHSLCCSCTTEGNGFRNGRFLLVWEENVENKNVAINQPQTIINPIYQIQNLKDNTTNEQEDFWNIIKFPFDLLYTHI